MLKSINYRADVFVNGQKIADKSQAVGMYNSFEFNVSKFVHLGNGNLSIVRSRIGRSYRSIPISSRS
jgi:exo-1,4-beta-D-glucosaminidase